MPLPGGFEWNPSRETWLAAKLATFQYLNRRSTIMP